MHTLDQLKSFVHVTSVLPLIGFNALETRSSPYRKRMINYFENVSSLINCGRILNIDKIKCVHDLFSRFHNYFS